MYEIKFSREFEKDIKKLKGKEAEILEKKIIEIQNTNNIDRYKNLRNKLKKFKRIHINKHFIMIFRLEKITNTILFYRYVHHNIAYK